MPENEVVTAIEALTAEIRAGHEEQRMAIAQLQGAIGEMYLTVSNLQQDFTMHAEHNFEQHNRAGGRLREVENAIEKLKASAASCSPHPAK